MNRGKCTRCGENEGTVHLFAIKAGRRQSIWLCAECARDVEREEADDAADGSLTKKYGHLLEAVLAGQENVTDGAAACPGCGTRPETFRRTNRLGCPRCYLAFRTLLLPMLSRFHRHVSHVGRVPGEESGAASRLGEITRTRVALEKAIAVEDFERAAMLRDRLRRLESGAGGTEGPES